MSFVSRRRVVQQQDPGLATAMRVPAQQVAGARITVDRVALRNRSAPRSAELLAAVASVDTTVDDAARAHIMAWIREQYDARQGGMLIGLFAKCHLGPPFVDHKLSLTHTILEHYSPADDPGHPYGTTRGLVRSGAYAHIEIYSDGAVVPIRIDGTPVEFTPST